MNDLVSAIKDFVYRDIAFILGGSLVILSGAYSLRHWLPSDVINPPTWSLFIFPALAYAVGYAVQDIGGVIRITYTGYVINPNRVCLWLYRRFVNDRWNPITGIRSNAERFLFDVKIARLDVPQSILRTLERILSLKIVGMCVGGCCLLCALILLCRWAYTLVFESAQPMKLVDNLALILGLICFWLGLSLVSLGWIKAMQQMQLLQAIDAENFPRVPSPRRSSTAKA